MSSEAVEKRIGKEWAVPNQYHNFPAAVVYMSDYGYKRVRCPIKDCRYDGFSTGFNQHYARTHAPDQWRQKAKRVLKALKQKEDL